jgi:hypothetical protein
MPFFIFLFLKNSLREAQAPFEVYGFSVSYSDVVVLNNGSDMVSTLTCSSIKQFDTKNVPHTRPSKRKMSCMRNSPHARCRRCSTGKPELHPHERRVCAPMQTQAAHALSFSRRAGHPFQVHVLDICHSSTILLT